MEDIIVLHDGYTINSHCREAIFKACKDYFNIEYKIRNNIDGHYEIRRKTTPVTKKQEDDFFKNTCIKCIMPEPGIVFDNEEDARTYFSKNGRNMKVWIEFVEDINEVSK